LRTSDKFANEFLNFSSCSFSCSSSQDYRVVQHHNPVIYAGMYWCTLSGGMWGDANKCHKKIVLVWKRLQLPHLSQFSEHAGCISFERVLLYVTEQKQHKSDKNSGPLKLLQHEGRVGRMAFKISCWRILLSAGACAQEWETGVLWMLYYQVSSWISLLLIW